MAKIFFLITSSLIFQYGFSQQNKLDSLLNELRKHPQEDTARLSLLNETARQYIIINPDKGIETADQAIALAFKLKDKVKLAFAYSSKAANYNARNNDSLSLQFFSMALNIYQQLNDKVKVATLYHNMGLIYQNSNYNIALEYENKALAVFEQLHDEESIAETYRTIGIDHYFLSEYPGALEYLQKALNIFERLGNRPGIAGVFTDMGLVYNHESQFSKALQYHQKGYEIYKQLDDKKGIADALINLGNVYDNMDDSAKALQSYQKALDISNATGYQRGIANSLNNMAIVYNYYDNYSRALEYFLKTVDFYETSGDKLNTSITLNEIAKLYANAPDWFLLQQHVNPKNRYSKAIQYLKRAVLLAKETGNILNQAFALESLSNTYEKQKDFAKALDAFKQVVLLRDSSFNNNKTKEITRLEIQYDFDKKEALAKAEQDKKDIDAKRIKSQQYVTISALAIIVLAVVIIALIQFRNNRHKQKANTLLQHQKEQIEEQKNKVESTLSELKSTQAQLIQSEKMASLGELTAGIAHEIQNPLNFVNNFSEVNKEMIDELQKELRSGNTEEAIAISNDIKDNEEKINHHGKRADAIVKGMLQHSKQTKGVKEPTDINALCDEYLRLSYHGMRAKDKSFNADPIAIGIKTDFDKSIGKITVVPKDIGRVLLNLFNNAFYATNEKKKTADENYTPLLSIQTKKINDTVEIIVSDNGNGIPSNIIDKIFQPFFTTKPTGQGTGLGLSLAYDIITKEHNGTIKVESKEGEGSQFIIELKLS